MADRWVDEPVPCFDPECAEDGGMGFPEADGDLRYYACPECGMEFGYEQVRQDAGACQIGIPEEVRRAASIAPAQDPQPVFLGTIGRRP
jgi:hypothetical protein